MGMWNIQYQLIGILNNQYQLIGFEIININ